MGRSPSPAWATCQAVGRPLERVVRHHCADHTKPTPSLLSTATYWFPHRRYSYLCIVLPTSGTDFGHQARSKGGGAAAAAPISRQVDGTLTSRSVGKVNRIIMALVRVECASRICIASWGSHSGTQPADIAPAYSASARDLYVASIVSEQAPTAAHANSSDLRRTAEVDAFMMPNVRAKRATTAGRQARAGENVPRTARPGLVACRWRSA